MADIRSGWKVLAHDGRSPIQRGGSLLTGPLPITLPSVSLDTGPDPCAAGWNYVADIPTGWRIAGMWSTGYPARLFAVEASRDAIQRGDKRRASSLTLVREATDQELRVALSEFSAPFFSWRDRMEQEQWDWMQALRRPHRDPAAVEVGLSRALSVRGLPWTLRRFDAARDAWAARATWTLRRFDAARDAWAARATWATWDAWAAWATWAARDARATWDAWAARDARATWDAWAAEDARATWDAWAALATLYARLMAWQVGEPAQYTLGIREAYANGLALALPVANNVLGWAAEESR